MIKFLEPFEHRPAPSRNPWPGTQWRLELVLMLMLSVPTNQLNYVVSRWGQLAVPCI